MRVQSKICYLIVYKIIFKDLIKNVRNESYPLFTEYHLMKNVSNLFVLFGSGLELKWQPQPPLENTQDYIEPTVPPPTTNTTYGISEMPRHL